MTRVGARVRVLGPVTVEDGTGEPVVARLRRLLAALAIARGEAASEADLIDAVWGESELPANPTKSLRTYLSRLRGRLGADSIARVAPGYRLATDRLWLDVVEFEFRLSEANQAVDRGDDRSAVASLEGALELWRGDAFGEFATETWAAPEAHRLNELRIDALLRRAELLIGLRDSDGKLVAELDGLAVAHPHREDPTRLLMVALHQQGRQADALAAFARYREGLATDLGLEPSPDLRNLEEQILLDDAKAVTLVKSRTIRGYEIFERLGEGAFSIVYRGTQPSVGRDVAMKQIRGELANRPEFIRRFEAEAHMVAALEHPHIVPLYDYWREPDSAYLVMRLLRGGSLESALRDGPLDLERTMRMVTEIGGALAVAHRAGVVHRDVKPANILFDEDGNAYLTDFGIALQGSEVTVPEAALSHGSPAYAAPEQLRREPVGPPADVHGLAIATFEALTGHLPFPDEPSEASLLQRQLQDPVPSVRSARDDVPAALDAVIARATVKSPTDRFQTVEEFLEALVDAGGTGPVTPHQIRPGVRTALSTDDRNPYKGLRAFNEADAADFAGRDRLVDQLVGAVGSQRLVTLVGPSGSGKSSVVHAGLVPALRKGAAPGSQQWFLTTMAPGAHPFEELEAALLRIATNRTADLLEVLTSGNRGIARAVRHALPDADGEVLVVIDQFEELFTSADPAEAARFLEALAAAVTEERSRLRVVATLRADFYDRPLANNAIGAFVRDATVVVLPLAPDELERAIVDPAHAVGAEFEPGLVAEMVADFADQPGGLPLLQYALTELYERRVSGMLMLAAYRESGGVAGALTRRAEALYSESTAGEQHAIGRVFRRLVTLGDGVEDTRRRALRSELDDSPETAAVLDNFGSARLLSFDVHPSTREPTVEVAHEALLRDWPRLRSWIEQDREGLRVLRRLHAAAVDWDSAGRPEADLYRGGRLEIAESWAGDHAEDLTPVEADFLACSTTLRSAEAEAHQRGTRRLRRLLAAVAVVAVVALLAGAIAFQQQRTANRNAEVADTARLASEAQARAETDPRLAYLLAAEAYRSAPGPETLDALQATMLGTGQTLGFLGNPDTQYLDVAWADADTIVSAHAGGVEVYDTGNASLELSHNADVRVGDAWRSKARDSGLVAMAVSPAGDLAAIATNPAAVEVFDLDTGRTTTLEHDAPVSTLAFSPNGRQLAAGDDNGAIALWDLGDAGALEDAAQRWQIDAHPEDLVDLLAILPAHTAEVMQRDDQAGDGLGNWDRGVAAITFSPDGETIVSADPATVRVWSSDSGSPVADYAAFGETTGAFLISTLLFDPDDPGVVHLGRDRIIAKLDLADGTLTPSYYKAPDNLTASESSDSVGVGWTIDGDAATLRIQGNLLVLDEHGETRSEYTAHVDAPAGFATSPTGAVGAVAGGGGIELVALDGRSVLATAIPRLPSTRNVSITLDEAIVSQSGLTNGPTALHEWSGSTYEPMAVPPDVEDIVAQVATTPAGTRLVGFDSGEALLFDMAGELLIDFGEFSDVGFSVDGKWVAKVHNGYVEVWDPSTGELVTRLEELATASSVSERGDISGAFSDLSGLDSADATAAIADDLLGLWNTEYLVGSLVFTADSAEMMATTSDGRYQVWNTGTWEPVEWSNDLGEVTIANFSPGGRYLATVDRQGNTVLRDAETLEPQVRLEGSNAPSLTTNNTKFVWSGDDRYVMTAFEAQPRLWDTETGRQIGRPFPSDSNVYYGAMTAWDGSQKIRLVTAVDDHVLVWNVDTESWFDTACRAAGRNMTAAEWEAFGPEGEPYHATCPQFPEAP